MTDPNVASIQDLLLTVDADLTARSLAAEAATQRALSAETDVASLTLANRTLTEANASLAQTNSQLAADLADCRDGEPPVPPISTAKMLCGSSADSGKPKNETFESFATRAGAIESIRSFNQPGEMPNSLLTESTTKSSVGKRNIVHSFKGRSAGIDASCQSLASGADDGWVAPFLDSKPATQALSTIWRHEPDEENATLATWQAAQHKMRALVDAANARGRAKSGASFVPIAFGANFMSFSARSRPARVDRLWVPGVWDFVSWDGYSETLLSQTPGAIFDKTIAWNKAHDNLPWGIGEFGQDGTTSTDREAWIRAIHAYAAGNKAIWIHYWNAIVNGNNYVLSVKDEKVLGSLS